VTKAAKEAADWSRREVRAAENAQIADMQSKGAKIARPDLASFREAVKPAYAKAKEKYGADVDTILGEASAVRVAMPAK
jgi:TRAP-type C4-dicarboxylate transport system substrate-binding protein